MEHIVMRYLFLFLINLPLICLPILANDENFDAPDSLNELNMLLGEDGGPAVDAAVLMYFGTLEGHGEAIPVLRNMVGRLRATGDQRVAPALAAVLNRSGVYDRTTPYADAGKIQSFQSRVVRNILADPATNAWLELMWPQMTEYERVDAVLNIIRPKPEIHLVRTNDVMKRAEEVQEPLRFAFYQQLLDPTVEYDWRSLWITSHVYPSMGWLMTVFPPTQNERKLIFDSARTMPRILYLYAHASPEDSSTFDLFEELLDENKDNHVVLRYVINYASQVAQESEKTKESYRKHLLKYAYLLLDNFREDCIDHWSHGSLFNLSHILFTYGKNEDTLALFIELRNFFNQYDPQLQNLPDFLKERLPPNIEANMKNIEFRIDMWTNSDEAEGNGDN